MSTSLSNIGKSDGAQRYTTTAIINCSSYPASTTVPAAADATTTTTTTSATVATSSATVATSSATVATSSATAGKSALNKWTVSVPAVSSSSPSTGIVVAENVGSSSALDRWKPRELLLSSPSSAVQDTNPTTLFGRNDLKSVNGTGSGSSKISVAAMGTSVNRSNKESSIKIKNGGATTNGFSNGVSGGFGGNATGKLPVPPPAPPALVCTKNGFSVSCSGDFDGNGAGKGPTSSPAPPALDLANNGLSNGVSGSVNAAGKVPVPPPAPPALGFRSNDERLNNRRAMNRADTPGHSFKPPSFASTNSLPRGFNSKSINSYNTAPKPFTLSSGAMSKRLLPAKNGSSGGVLNQPTSVSESPSSANTTTMFTPAAAFSPATKNSPICSSSVLGGANPGNPKTLLARRASESAASGGSSDPSASSAKPKVDSNDPQVRKLVYNMYRGLLDQKHDQSNTIINSLPQLQVDRDEGVKNRVISMMKQQEDLKAGKQTNMNGPAGPPPPPPPPPFLVPGMTPPVMPEPAPAAPSAVGGRPSPRGPPIPMVAPPAALAGAMMKDRKPFTYTPGGLDLSEISPGPILPQASDPLNPTQSRSFRLLQTVVDGEASGSDDEIRGFLHPQDGNSQSAEEKTCSGGSSYSKGRNNSLILSPLAYDNHHHQQQQQHQQQLSQQQQSPSKFQNKYLFDEDDIQRGSSLEPKTSKFFRRLQTITDTLPAGVEPQGPVHIGKIKPKQQPARQQGTPATGIAPSSSIPSRSFRTLQQYTDAQHDVAGLGESDL